VFSAFIATSLPGSAAQLDRDSQACQECHALPDWQINDPVTGRVVVLSIDSDAYLESSHARASCRACHAWGYDEIPHRGSSEHPIYECVFCHTDDTALEHFRLPDRKDDLRASVHGETEAGRLDCHTCHDPHVFQPVNRSDDPLRRIETSNAICLGCHGPEPGRKRRFARDDSAAAHRAFPNYANHVRKVKCVACHTSQEADTTGHEILSREASLSDCEACHGGSSPILDAIYGSQQLADAQPGPGDAYVIGSSRSPVLERISIAFFGVTCVAILVHALARGVVAIRDRRR
jgi:hypothetical protein